MAKENYEFVLVREHANIVSDLKVTSENMQKGTDAAFEAAALHSQKHEGVQAALALADAIGKTMDELKKGLPIKDAGPAKPAAAPKLRQVSQPAVDSDFVARSQKALQHLDKNISELKDELRKIK